MKKIMCVFGTRPEAIKICPLVLELKKREGLETVVCVTAQHRQMLDQVLETFHIVPDYDLNIMKDQQTLFDITTNILNSIRNVLEEVKPDVVLVHGDTSTTFVTALACFYLQIPVGHVEAGLRTYNIYSPYPEEFNRQGVGIISAYNFSPTPLAARNLLREGKKPEVPGWVTEEMRNRNMLTLSGGERQRAFLAQVFCQDPEILMLDEPANHLDLPFQKELFSLIGTWLETPGRAVVTVMHDLSLARKYGTHALLMDRGRCVAQGKASEVLAPGILREVYGMDVRGWMLELLGLWKD